ncbi:MAG: thioredoxin family protein [Bacteroidetes bacterium]|nr:thioredoxin family protein [Bacteroidota bacterium]
MKAIISVCFLCCSLIVFSQEKSRTLDKLTYLSNSDLDKGIAYAKEKSKPLMIYFNSLECSSCEKYVATVMSEDTVEKYLKAKYICVKANMKNDDAARFAKKFQFMSLPQIVLISPDQTMHYMVEMKLDAEMTIKQAAYFLNAVALRNQIELYQKTNNIDEEKASEAMAISYAKRDFKKTPSAHVEDLLFSRCLNMKQFHKFIEYYKREWTKLNTPQK